MLLVLVLTAAVLSPPLSTSVWGLLAVGTHLAALRVEPVLRCHSIPMAWGRWCAKSSISCTLHPPICLPPTAFCLHTEPWGTPASTQAAFWGVSGAHTSSSMSQTKLRWLHRFALALVLQTLPFVKVWHRCWGHMVPFPELIILQPGQ